MWRYTKSNKLFQFLKDKKKEKKDVSLVLSTGGARGLAHVGAIDQLLSMGYHIRAVSGTSMGALVGGMYAAGKLEEFKQWMQTIDRKKILSLIDFSFSISHISKGERIIKALKDVVPDVNIEDLPIPYSAIATDAITGTEVVFTSGSLYEAIRASISLPLFFSPVKSDGRLLVDGGLVNPLPLNRVVRSKEDLLVAVNVSGHDYLGQVKLRKVVRETASERSRMMSFINRIIPEDADINYYTLMNRSVSIMIQKNAELSVKLLRPDILIDIPMNRYDTFDFDKYDRLAGIGRAKTKKAIERWLQAK